MFYISVMVCINSVRNLAETGKNIKFTSSKPYVTFKNCGKLLKEPNSDVFVSESGGVRTNPILEAVKKAVPIIKPEREKIAESLHDMILDVTKAASDAMGKDAVVFPVPNHSDMVLRVEKSALSDIGKLPSDLELVPVTYQKDITKNKHLGLPLYFVAPKGSQIAKKTQISPLEAMAQPDKIMVLRRVTGEHPSVECGDKFMSMLGFEDFSNPDPNLLNNFYYLYGYVQRYFGDEAMQKCLKMFKEGATEIPEHALGEGSSSFKVVNGKEFYSRYKTFAESYVKSLRDISEFPQKSYQEAVDFIVSPKNFNIDFQHTNNTFVDLQKQEFNFMDFAYDKNDPKYIYKNPVLEFRNVLLGKGFRRIDALRTALPNMPRIKYPRDLIVEKEDRQNVMKYFKVINEKVLSATPENYR